MNEPKLYDLSKPHHYEQRYVAGQWFVVPVFEPEPLTEEESRILRNLDKRLDAAGDKPADHLSA